MAAKVSKGTRNQLVPGLAVHAGQLIAARYRVDELLGSGPSGVVLAAKHVIFRTDVTLKILAAYTDSQTEVVDRRITKARRATRLQGPHVARILDIGLTDDAMPYVASERVEGVMMTEEMATRGRLPVNEAVRWILEACEGLAEAHAFGLVHGDLKPANLFLAEPSKKQRAQAAQNPNAPADDRVLKILDFGSTSPLDAMGEESASAFFGSPAFLSPEQIQDPTRVDARADIWALGALLFHLTMGHPPFEADTLSGVLVAVVYDAPALLTEAPYELAKIVAQCLDKDPTKRPNDVAELARHLAPFAGAYGKECARRVAAMLDAPMPSVPSVREPALADLTASESIAPISLDVLPPPPEEETSADPIPLVKKAPSPPPTLRSLRVRRDDVTRPSRRVSRTSHRRMQRSHLASLLGIGAAAGLALASFVGEPPRSFTLPITAAKLADTPLEPLTHAAAVVPAFVPPTETPPEPAPTPLEQTMNVPTPIVPLGVPAAAAPPPSAPVPIFHPQPPPPSQRPAAFVQRRGAPSSPPPLPPSVVSRRRDDEYLRLFTDRK